MSKRPALRAVERTVRSDGGLEFGPQLLHPLLPRPGHRLVRAGDDPFERRGLVQGSQRHRKRRDCAVGLAMIRRGTRRSASAFTSGITSGTSASWRNAAELSITIAPAPAA